MFLLGRQAMLGHDPPISPRSTTAVRRPAFAIVQARYLPASPLPMIRISNWSLSGIIVSKESLGPATQLQFPAGETHVGMPYTGVITDSCFGMPSSIVIP